MTRLYLTEGHLQFANDLQKEMIKLFIDGESFTDIGNKAGLHRTNVKRQLEQVVNVAAVQGYLPAHGVTNPLPDSMVASGLSMFRKDELGHHWLKAKLNKTEYLKLVKEVTEDLVKSLPRIKSIAAPKVKFDKDMMAVVPLGDPNVGMLAWAKETGQDWDLDISEDIFGRAAIRTVTSVPPCAEFVILNLGDFFHYDNFEGTTSRSGHIVDRDSRYPQMIATGMRIMRRFIDTALEYHKTVRVVNVTGNHDDAGSIWLSVTLPMIYEHNKRVIFDNDPVPVHTWTWGKNMFSSHHGNNIKPKDLPAVMACDFSKEWGESEYRYGFVGHFHHSQVQEHPGCLVEIFRTLAAKDAYATWNKYRSLQDVNTILYHKEYGAIERHIAPIKLLRDM